MDLARGALSWNVLFSNVIGGLACAPCYLVPYSCDLVAVGLREQVARALSLERCICAACCPAVLRCTERTVY